MKKNLLKNFTTLAVCTLGMGALFAFSGCVYGDVDPVAGADTAPVTTPAAASFTPGSHTATTAGAWGAISVTLHTDANQITGVDIEHQETPMFVDAGFASIQSDILALQTPHGIDAFSGATVSTEPLLAAARQAFAYATGATTPATPERFVPGTYTGIVNQGVGGIGEGATNVAVTFSGSSITALTINSHMNTGETVTEADNQALIAAVLENQGTDGVAIEGAPNATANFVGAVQWAIDIAEQQLDFVLVEAAPGSGNNPIATGVYITSFPGRNDDIVVGLGIVNGTIIRAVAAHRETSAFVDDAILQIVTQVVEGQTVEVDTVAGATFSTGLIIGGFQQLFADATN
ncbi:MAG: FMN-binding protein [Defluviitaleaceae bacterium]|nr:FMN-binding protein [Defluviitaleaceae bacterium]